MNLIAVRLVIILILLINKLIVNALSVSRNPICNKELYTIDSATIIDSSNIFLFTGDLAYKLMNNSVGIGINVIQEIRGWDKNIEIPIDNSCGLKVCPSKSCLTIKNLKSNKFWIIDVITNKVVQNSWGDRNRNSTDCLNAEGFDDFYVDRSDGYNIAVRADNRLYFIRTKNSNGSQLVKLILKSGDLKNTSPFILINNSIITAGFIRDKFWYFFGGEYVCEMKLSPREWNPLCVAKPLTDWILCDMKSTGIESSTITATYGTASTTNKSGTDRTTNTRRRTSTESTTERQKTGNSAEPSKSQSNYIIIVVVVVIVFVIILLIGCIGLYFIFKFKTKSDNIKRFTLKKKSEESDEKYELVSDLTNSEVLEASAPTELNIKKKLFLKHI